jgi:hypothetical protein
VRTIRDWLDKVTAVFQRYLPPPSPSASARGEEEAKVRTISLLWERDVRTMVGWLDNVTYVFQRYPTPPPEVRRRRTCEPGRQWG